IATGEVDILIGGGEWVTAGLTADIPELDWVIPEQGGVRWSQSMQAAAKDYAELAFHELAPGKVLTGLMRRTAKSIKVANHAEPS
ncbi:MAG: hypothetical protein AAFY08_15210, partial [Planctomycetota bacterium]